MAAQELSNGDCFMKAQTPATIRFVPGFLSDTRIRPQIVAVIVLYRMSPEESPSFCSMQKCLAASEELRDAIDLMLWDNTPGKRTPPVNFAGHFVHDGSNPGLAAAYNAALLHAMEYGAPWLMLLDQDTVITESFLREALSVSRISNGSALIPHLTWKDRVISPFLPSLLAPPSPLADSVRGAWHQPLQAFNSGAVFFVEELKRVGGFDNDFPIDYLDHATFSRLYAMGGHAHVLDARIEHALVSQTPGALNDEGLKRERDILAGERRFFLKYGTFRERQLFPLRLLRRAASVAFHKHDIRNARMILRTLLGLTP
jgi:glycosyltransferase involved in cell wall biosynthesis